MSSPRLAATPIWNTGCRFMERAGLSCSTRTSKGRSERSRPSSVAPRTSSHSSVKVVEAEMRWRITKVLTNSPTRSVRASSSRPATCVPSTTSSTPKRLTRAATSAWFSMWGVHPRSRSRARSRSRRAAGTVTNTRDPLPVATAGRAVANDSSVSCGAPASRVRQYSVCSWASDPGSWTSPSSSRCQAAKSAYWTSSGSRSQGVPSRRAA